MTENAPYVWTGVMECFLESMPDFDESTSLTAHGSVLL